MEEAGFSYQLDLILRLIDTTTGIPVAEHQAVFREDGHVLALLERDEGLYVLLNHGRKHMRLNIDVRGYEPVEADVDYEELNPRFPKLEIPLIPLPRERGFEDLYTISGKERGLLAVSAVRLDDSVAQISGYVERKQVLKLFTAKDLAEETYGLVHKDSQQFEEITVARKIDRLSLKLLKPLTGGFKPEEPLSRIVRGRVKEDGSYLLRVRDMGGSNIYLVCFRSEGGALYREIDFSASDQPAGEA